MIKAIEPLKSFKIIRKRSKSGIIPSKDAELISDLGNPAAWLLDIFNGSRTISGEFASHETAIMLDSYFAAIRNISEDIAKLPFNIFEIVENGEKLVTNHRAQELIHRYANDDMSTMSLMQTVIHWALSYGNGFAEIVRNARGEAVQMFPIHPSRIKPFRARNQKLFWEVRGTISNIQGAEIKTIILPDEDVFNLRGLGDNGIIGYSAFAVAADSVGQGLAVQKFASAYFGNATNLSGALVAPGKLSEKEYKNMRESWNKIHAGKSENKHQVAIMESGMKFEKMSSTAAEAQLIEAQKFTVERIARLLRIPPHKIGHNTGLVKANFEAENIAYFRDTLMSWIIRISLEADRKIIKDPRFTARYEVNALTLGDSMTRARVFKMHRDMGTMSINDVLRLENQNVIDEEWANERHMQMNITTVQNISEGANLSSKNPDQTPDTNLDSGETDEEASDPEATEAATPPVEIDALTMLNKAKKDHMPNFKYTAHRLVNKESMMIEKKLKSYTDDPTGFEKWATFFFDKQKAEMVEVFEPCCQVLSNTFNFEGVELKMDFLPGFANSYGEDGKVKAIETFQKMVKGEDLTEDIDKNAEKLANSVINLMCK